MRVLHVVHSLDDRMGGAVHAAVGLAAHVGGVDGVETVLASTVQPGDDHAYLDRLAPDVERHVFPRSWPAGRFQSAALASWLRRSTGSFDLVHLHGVFHAPALAVRRAYRTAGVPYLLSPHGQLDPFDLAKHRRQKQLFGPVAVRPLVGDAASVVLTTAEEEARLVTFGAEARTVVVPLPVAPLGPGDGAAFRARHGIPADAVVVLFLSRLDVKKGLNLLTTAMAGLDGAWLVVAGSGDPAVEADLATALDGTDLGRRTVRTGFISGTDKDDAFAAADVFALPSRNENFGIVVVEAMGAGVPVVVSDETYIHGEIEAAGAGSVCRVDASSCRDALRPLVTELARRAEAGRRAAELARSRFSPAAATSAMVEAYRSLLTGAPR